MAVFFFIPLGALQTCIVPVISYNYASGRIDRCKKTLSTSLVGGMGLMFIGTLVFNLIPGQMLRVFTSDPQVIAIGTVGFHFVGISFIPMVTSLIFRYFSGGWCSSQKFASYRRAHDDSVCTAWIFVFPSGT